MVPLPIGQRIDNPSIIDLGWGHPDPALLPVSEMRRACDSALAQYGAEALEYGSVAGPGPLLEWLLARVMSQEGRALSPAELLITSGISGGLDLVLSALTQPLDTVLVESPTYHLAIKILQDRGLHLVPVPSDENGTVVEALSQQLTELKRVGKRARAFYTVPTFNNPTGASLSAARRQAVVAVAVAEGLSIIEDDVYRDLGYDGPAPPSLWSLAPTGTVARLGSFSKSLAPGLRLGWLTAGPELIARLTHGGLLDSSGGVNHFTALVVANLCAAGHFDTHVARLCEAYRTRRDALRAGLSEHLPDGCRFDSPAGGFFIWVTLPSAVRSRDVLPQAEAAGMSFIPGSRFHVDGLGHSNLRLAFSLYDPPNLVEGARRLGQALWAFGGGTKTR